jgi:DNA polymerase-3 subunit epsilon
MRYAIVDIETTGGSPVYHRIVEVAIVMVENGEVTDEFSSLCHPEMTIPLNVQLIHGISDEMVADAPTFSDLIPEIEPFLRDSIFVAHSASFDYGFIKAEYQRAGLVFNKPKLCTVRMGRQLEPGLKSYSLANLCRTFEIENKTAHRALSDALATSQIFLRYLQNPDFESVSKHFLGRKNKAWNLPPNLRPEAFQKLPQTTGVYLFHDHKGKVVYVGKANQIKDRVLQHFSGHTHTKAKSNFADQIFDVSFQESGHELMALLLENELVKKHFPRYNSTLKEFKMGGGIFKYEDQKGFLRLVTGDANKWSEPVKVFKSKGDAHLSLLKFSMENSLCLKLNHFFGNESKECQYETSEGKTCLICHKKRKKEAYNEHLIHALQNWDAGKSLVLEMPGRSEEENGLVLIENGKIKGFGFLNWSETEASLSAIKAVLKPYYDTQDSQTIIKPYLAKARPKAVLAEGISLLSLV